MLHIMVHSRKNGNLFSSYRIDPNQYEYPEPVTWWPSSRAPNPSLKMRTLFQPPCKGIPGMFNVATLFQERSFCSHFDILTTVAWRGLWNFIVFQVKFNRFLHPNEHAQRIFWYLVKRFDWEPSKIRLIFTPQSTSKLREMIKWHW